jgi:putative PIN family toxin of toxin-antitoxin system
MAGIRVVLDANVLVSGVAYSTSIPGSILDAWLVGGLTVILSDYILEEAIRVLPKFPALAMSAADLRDLADNFRSRAQMVEPDSMTEPALRDPKDQQVLGTLRVSGADYLITGDKDLLALAEKYPIVTPAAFWAKHGG